VREEHALPVDRLLHGSAAAEMSEIGCSESGEKFGVMGLVWLFLSRSGKEAN
jgi:hypothetical protein